MTSKSTAAAAALMYLVLSALVLTQAARPMPTSQTEQIVDDLHVDDVEADDCAGLGEAECLARRTLAAHVDYIYTQHKPKN